MSDAVETIVVQGDGLALDAIIWQRYRRPMPGFVERVLDLNQGLAALGPFIPHGTTVQMPIEKIDDQVPVRSVVSLWD